MSLKWIILQFSGWYAWHLDFQHFPRDLIIINDCTYLLSGTPCIQNEARVDTCESFQLEAFVLGDVYFAFIRITSDGIFRFSETTCRCDQLVCGLIYRNALVLLWSALHNVSIICERQNSIFYFAIKICCEKNCIARYMYTNLKWIKNDISTVIWLYMFIPSKAASSSMICFLVSIQISDYNA